MEHPHQVTISWALEGAIMVGIRSLNCSFQEIWVPLWGTWYAKVHRSKGECDQLTSPSSSYSWVWNEYWKEACLRCWEPMARSDDFCQNGIILWYKLSSHRISPTLNYIAAQPEQIDLLVHWLVFNRQNHWLDDTRGGRALRWDLCTWDPFCTPALHASIYRSVHFLTVSSYPQCPGQCLWRWTGVHIE